MHQSEFLRFISTRDWQTGLSANLAHSLFLWSPWAKNGFYIFKWLRKKEKKKKKRGAGEGEGRGQKHVTETRSILQSFKLSGPLQEKLSAPGLVHPMELFLLPASSTFHQLPSPETHDAQRVWRSCRRETARWIFRPLDQSGMVPPALTPHSTTSIEADEGALFPQPPPP